jgi:hypothetical protein
LRNLVLHIVLIAFAAALGVAGTGATKVQAVNIQAPRPKPVFQIRESNAEDVIIDVTPPAYSPHVITVDGKQMIEFGGSASGSTAETGEANLPSEGFLVGIPPGMQPVVDIMESKFSTATSTQEVAPAPGFTYTKDHVRVAAYHEDPNFYQTHNRFYPEASMRVAGQARIRDLTTLKINVFPLQYNPVTKQLKRMEHYTIRVKFEPSVGGSVSKSNGKSFQSFAPVTSKDPLFDPVYNEMVLNYNEAQAWRTAPAKNIAAVPVDSTAAWFHTNQRYVKVPVITDGLYHLTYAYLLSFGFDMKLLNNTSAAVYFKGVPQPVRVYTSDTSAQNWYIDFYAHRNYATNSYFDAYDDTSTYWLTWNDPHPFQIIDAAPTSAAPTDSGTWYIQNLWVEKDLNFFYGVTDDDIETPGYVPGKGWYWETFVPGTSYYFPFTLDSIQRKTGVLVQLKARLNGMTECTGGACTAPSRHEAYFYINKHLIDSLNWIENTEGDLTTYFPDSILRKGLDSLRVVSKTWTAQDMNISEFYLDWFQINYPHPLYSTKGSLNFTVPPSPTTKAVTFKLSGIPADSATILDLTYGRRITNLTKTSATTFTFVDTLSAPRNYYVVKSASEMTPATLIPKTFVNLRNAANGADYLIVKHSAFNTDAARLAAFHASKDKLRTALVDVQDIYDEFNYGQLDPVAIRTFLTYAFYNWRRPAPVYAVFFGDATWDFKKTLSTSIMNNYVPSFGNPPSDNDLVSFDSTLDYIPFMLTGRIPVKTSAEAASVVNKIINYSVPPVSTWDKNFMFITGGDTPNEQETFDYYSSDLINRYVTPYPIGGTVTTVYKSSLDIIDGENLNLMQGVINNGVTFVNYIGHSGGRIWGVDIGSPYDMQNTNGQLPFISSVSCNVGFFSDPASDVLSEDFILADNRAGIACWAASSIDDASTGRFLDDKFLSLATADQDRTIGQMTAMAGLAFWLANAPTVTPTVVEVLNLHPLIGDPLTKIAIPTAPDYAIGPSDLAIVNPTPTSDSSLTLRVSLRNQGLMAGSPILVSATDSYTPVGGQPALTNIAPPFYIPDFIAQDTFFLHWNVMGQSGNHTVTVQVDPLDSIAEVQKSNNIAQQAFYIYKNSIDVVSPVPFGVVSVKTPTLTVTTPFGSDTTALKYYFQLDTVQTFTSPFLLSSPPIVPGKVSASWTSPPLGAGRTYYWRAQTNDGVKSGAWVVASFTVSANVQSPDTVTWQQGGDQLSYASLNLAVPGQSGVTLAKSDSTTLFVRSLGYRANENTDYYGLIDINQITALGYWWEEPYSYLAGWYNPSTGAYNLTGFNLLTPGYTDSMTAYLSGIPNGYYVMLSAVEDAAQNTTTQLYQQIQALGSTQITNVKAGQSWMMISLKGIKTPIYEVYSPSGIAESTVVIPNVYQSGVGTVLSPRVGPAAKWYGVTGNFTLPNSYVAETLCVLGVKSNNGVDTLATLAPGIFSASLASVDVTKYAQVQLYGKLSNTDGATTPILNQWQVQYQPVPDLSVSAWTLKIHGDTLVSTNTLSASLVVYNLGTKPAYGTSVSCYHLEDTTQRFDTVIDTLAAGAQKSLSFSFAVTGSVGTHMLVARIQPHTGTNDLIADNNTTTEPFIIRLAGHMVSGKVKVAFDDVEIHDGDYVSPKPLISVTYPQSSTPLSTARVIASIDGKDITRYTATASAKDIAMAASIQSALTRISLPDPMADGTHVLSVLTPDAGSGAQNEKITFEVSAKADIKNAFNYPNPFSNGTTFSYILTGTHLPTTVKVRIYTVAGRAIREIDVPRGQIKLGYNRVTWDGRDDRGDDIANGYYFFKIATSDGVEAIQKCAKIR